MGTGWLGIPGHVLGEREVREPKPGGTIHLLCPNLAGERRETKKSVRVNRPGSVLLPLNSHKGVWSCRIKSNLRG